MPAWSRDGRLFYETLDNHILTAEWSSRGDSFQVSKPRLWSNKELFLPEGASNFTLAPDSKRIAALMPPEAMTGTNGSVHVTFLLNFFDELRRRVPVSGK